MINSRDNYIKKELKNTDTKQINSNLLVDTGINIIGKKNLKLLLLIKGSGLTLTNNQIKDITKVIRSIENRGILLKGTTKKITLKMKDFSVFFFIIDSRSTINEKCTYTFS